MFSRGIKPFAFKFFLCFRLITLKSAIVVITALGSLAAAILVPYHGLFFIKYPTFDVTNAVQTVSSSRKKFYSFTREKLIIIVGTKNGLTI